MPNTSPALRSSNSLSRFRSKPGLANQLALVRHSFVIGCLLAMGVCSASAQTTVFLLSLDGIRSDYIERGDTPFFDRLMEEGAWSLETKPSFPTVTFASHATISTGALASVHGVVNNSFLDRRQGHWARVLRYPGPQELLEAEPIWTTVTRQGIRTLVLDWVMSHSQSGPYATAYFAEQYARGLSDRDRIGRVLAQWEADDAETPLRFILAYGESPDSEGHRYGPDSPKMDEVMAEVDALASEVFEQVRNLWLQQRKDDNEEFVFILLSDHGMGPVHTLVNLGNAAGISDFEGVRFVTGANIAHIFLPPENEASHEEVLTAIEKRLSKFGYLQSYRYADIPEEWQYQHPHRTGNLVVILDPGYTFSQRPEEVTLATGDDVGPLGMHGYHPDLDPTMTTVFFAWREGPSGNFGGVNLGEIQLLQVHATVAALFGIEPSPQAYPHPIAALFEQANPATCCP